MIHKTEDGALSYDEQMENGQHDDGVEVAGMIWEQELRDAQRRRVQNAFLAGVLVACVGIILLCWGVVVITDGQGVCL